MSAELMRLVERCKGTVYVTFNSHRVDYETTAEYVARHDDIAPEVKAEMVVKDLVIEIQFYPRTPISFYVVTGASLDALVAEAHQTLDNEHE